MKLRSWILGLAALIMMGLVGAVLARSQSMFRLGKPGLKIVAEPIYDPQGDLAGTNQMYLPAEVLNCRSEARPITNPELETLPKDTTFGRRRYFAPDGLWFDVNVVLMGTDRTSIHKPEYCLPAQGFVIDRNEITSMEIKKPHPYLLPISKIVASIRSKGPVVADGREEAWSAVFVYWFVADGNLTASHRQRMWRMGREMIRTGTLQRWAYVSCLAVCRPGDEDATFERMKQFLAAAVPEFQVTAGTSSPSVRGNVRDESRADVAR